MTRIATDYEGVAFVAHQPEFTKVLGAKPTAQLLLQSTDKKTNLFHEACIYHHATRSVFVTSNQLPTHRHSPHTSSKEVKLLRIYDSGSGSASSSAKGDAWSSPGGYASVDYVHFEGIEGAMLNGGVNFGQDSLLMCAMGSKRDEDLQGLIAVEIPKGPSPSPSPSKAAKVETVVSSFYGIPFNSVNDVIVDPRDDSIWFTDPHYGFHQEIRRQPQLPNQVYRFDPKTKSIRAIADGFTRPNGLCFSPELDKLYVTDTGGVHGSSSVAFDPTGPSHIYCYDIVRHGSEPVLTNKRLFAFAAGRCPDGIKCDTRGNVYSGCLDGIEVWNPAGVLIGTITVPGCVANFCFGEKGTIYACNETLMWKFKLDGEGVKGALLGL